MRILHIHQTIDSRAGGVVKAMLQLACEQVNQGHDVEIFSTDLGFPSGRSVHAPNSMTLYSGVKIHHFHAYMQSFAFSLSLLMALVERVKSFDIVHIHGLYRFPQIAAGFMARRSRVPYLVQTHGTLDNVVYVASARSLTFKRLYECLLGFPLLRRANALYYTCAQEQARGQELGLNINSFVTENGVDIGRFRMLPPRGNVRARLGLGEQPIILFVGRINFKKGLDLLVMALGDVIKRQPEALLVLAGPDNEGYGGQIESIARNLGIMNHLVFTGMLEEQELIEVYVGADLFVLPSYGENFGMSVVEAMACGCPVIVSDSVGIAHDIQRADAGLVVPCNADSIARAILSILECEELGCRLARAGMELVRDKYAISGVTEALTDKYAGLVDSR